MLRLLLLLLCCVGSCREAPSAALLELHTARGQCGLCQASQGFPFKEPSEAVRIQARGAARLPLAAAVAVDGKAPQRLDGCRQHPAAYLNGDWLHAGAVTAVLCGVGMLCSRACPRRRASIMS